MSNRLLHTKVSKRKPLKNFPKKEDGYNGDMQIVSINLIQEIDLILIYLMN